MRALLDRLLGRGLPPADEARWIVLDVETSGLDPHRARLLAIAAIAVRTDGAQARIDLADSFEVVIQQPALDGGPLAQPERENILVHGIGVGAQRAGVPRARALADFGAYIGRSPLVAFHAPFDQTLIERAHAAEGLPVPGNGWLDLEPLAAVLKPAVRARSLDEWMAALDIRCAVRHQAAADTLATAELLLKLWPLWRAEQPRGRFRDAVALAAQRRWLPQA